MTRPILLILISLAALAPGCRGAAGPAEAYRAFAAAARAGDSDTVWGLLSARSRQRLDERARATAATAPGGVVPASGKELVLGDLAVRAARIASVTVVRESAGAAVVAVQLEGGGGGEVSLAREGGVWRVVLPSDN